MECDTDHTHADLIELGSASDDTHGAGHLMPEATGLWNREGISDE